MRAAKDPRVRQVTASVGASWQVVEILRADGHLARDVRPLVRVNVSDRRRRRRPPGDRQPTAWAGAKASANFSATDTWQHGVDEALRQALVNLEPVPAPAGTFDIVLGPGWPGVMLHEAVGHGLEGDFNRKKTSAFAGLMGEQVAAKGVTVVDDGTMADRRGSLTVDDEGTPTQPHGPDRGRHARRLHAGPPERAADGHARRPATAGASPTRTSRCRA